VSDRVAFDGCISGSGHVTLVANASGSGRVTFSSFKSYVKAVSAAFVEIKTAKFTKKVRISRFTPHFTTFTAENTFHTLTRVCLNTAHHRRSPNTNTNSDL